MGRPRRSSAAAVTRRTSRSATGPTGRPGSRRPARSCRSSRDPPARSSDDPSRDAGDVETRSAPHPAPQVAYRKAGLAERRAHGTAVAVEEADGAGLDEVLDTARVPYEMVEVDDRTMPPPREHAVGPAAASMGLRRSGCGRTIRRTSRDADRIRKRRQGAADTDRAWSAPPVGARKQPSGRRGFGHGPDRTGPRDGCTDGGIPARVPAPASRQGEMLSGPNVGEPDVAPSRRGRRDQPQDLTAVRRKGEPVSSGRTNGSKKAPEPRVSRGSTGPAPT